MNLHNVFTINTAELIIVIIQVERKVLHEAIDH